MRSALQSRLRNFAAIFLAWTVVGIFFFTQGLVQKSASHDPTPWWHYLLTWLIGVYLSALLTPAVLLCIPCTPPNCRRNWFRRS